MRHYIVKVGNLELYTSCKYKKVAINRFNKIFNKKATLKNVLETYNILQGD